MRACVCTGMCVCMCKRRMCAAWCFVFLCIVTLHCTLTTDRYVQVCTGKQTPVLFYTVCRIIMTVDLPPLILRHLLQIGFIAFIHLMHVQNMKCTGATPKFVLLYFNKHQHLNTISEFIKPQETCNWTHTKCRKYHNTNVAPVCWSCLMYIPLNSPVKTPLGSLTKTPFSLLLCNYNITLQPSQCKHFPSKSLSLWRQ